MPSFSPEQQIDAVSASIQAGNIDVLQQDANKLAQLLNVQIWDKP